jgi:hypothetical protein
MPMLAFLVAGLCLFNSNKALAQSQSIHYNVGVACADTQLLLKLLVQKDLLDAAGGVKSVFRVNQNGL